MQSDWQLELSVVEKRGSRRYSFAINLSTDDFGDGLVDDMRAGLAFAGPEVSPFAETVTVLRRRQFRREALPEIARQLGAKLADYIEDREGWHGTGRQQTAKANPDQRPKR
jgi:hypothetical protein